MLFFYYFNRFDGRQEKETDREGNTETAIKENI